MKKFLGMQKKPKLKNPRKAEKILLKFRNSPKASKFPRTLPTQEILSPPNNSIYQKTSSIKNESPIKSPLPDNLKVPHQKHCDRGNKKPKTFCSRCLKSICVSQPLISNRTKFLINYR